MEEFVFATSNNLNSIDEPYCEILWIFGTSKTNMVIEKSNWCKDILDQAYIPIPYPKKEFKLMEGMHCLATLDACILNHNIKLCNE